MKKTFIEMLSNLHLKHRLREYNKYGSRVNGVKLRNSIHSFLLQFVILDRKKVKRELIVINGKRVKTTKQTIFAATHIGGADIESIFEAIQTPAWLLLGDPNDIYLKISGLLLWLNGVICVETRNKIDRKISKERCISVLKKGGNLLIFPEGAWNISPNRLVYYLYYGAVNMAFQTNAQIIPVGVIRTKNKYYVNIGDIIVFPNDCRTEKEKTYYLRDKMASLQWETIELLKDVNSQSINKNYYQKWIKECFDVHGDTYSINDVIETRFNPTYITDKEKVFEHLNHIQPNYKTAFLFNKRNHN